MTPKHSEDYHDALWWALQTAADMIEECVPAGATTQRDYDLHREGAIEAAKRIQRMADRYFERHLAKKTNP
jgi:hypothetical protein